MSTDSSVVESLILQCAFEPETAVDMRFASEATQPPLLATPAAELYVAIAGFALGGAERIVLDWARRLEPPWIAHLIVLRDHAHEWEVPSSLRVTRFHGVDVLPQLTRIGRAIARTAVPVCVCHLLTAAERQAIGSSGAFIVPVIHNAEAGWLEPAAALENDRHVIAVSESSACDLRRRGFRGAVSVIRHLPRPRRFPDDARIRWRRRWRIPANAVVVGMIGAVKPQKDYPFAVRLLRELSQVHATTSADAPAVRRRAIDLLGTQWKREPNRDGHRNVFLVIVGGPIGKHGRSTWEEILAEMRRGGVRHRLAMPGFIPDAAACLPAFDLLLNTSDYEGLSIATLDALVNGVPVVASRVGGQGELAEAGLTLVGKDSSSHEWIDAILQALEVRPVRPSWEGFPAHRSWTLAQLARPFDRTSRVLFVTANLNAGGAQRSLVNLASALPRLHAGIAVTGNSTASYFFDALSSSGVPVHRTASTRAPFDHAERLVHKICADRIGIVCFWNVDPKIKLLVTRALACTEVAFVDVSPGPAAFEEMRAAAEFGRLIAFSEDEYYARIDRLVLKYHGHAPASCGSNVVVIPNGVAAPLRVKTCYDVACGAGRIAINGRIAPAKFVVEIVEAMAQVRRRHPHVELHVFGSVEPRYAEYAETVRAKIGSGIGRWVFFHGAGARTIDALPDYDAFVVLGQNQGSPNALLEALAAGLPCVANDEGGTAEQILHERTGLLVADRSASALAAAIERILVDRELAARVGVAGRRHVLSLFGLELMASRYASLFESLAPRSEAGVQTSREEKTA